MSELMIVDHPLVQHNLTLMRQKETPTAEFRLLVREVALLLAYEITRTLPLVDTSIDTPLERMQSAVLAGKKALYHFNPARWKRSARRHAGSDTLGPRRPYPALP